MNRFKNIDDIKNTNLKMQPEYYNAFVCEKLKESYERMKYKA